MRITRLWLALIGVCLAAVLVAAAHRTDFPRAKTGATAHVERSHEPWKSTAHKLGLRRSSEPVKSLLVSPRVHVFPLEELTNGQAEHPSPATRTPLLVTRSPRAPPLPSVSL